MKKVKRPLTFDQYARIHNVARTLITALHDEPPEHSCVQFTFIGGLLMSLHYNLRASFIAGPIRFSGDSGFMEWPADLGMGGHACVLCDGHLIDFMAPLYPRMSDGHVPESRMLQLPLDHPRLRVQPDPALMDHITRTAMLHAPTHDLLRMAEKWHRPVPRRMEPGPFKLLRSNIDGVWS